MTITLDGLDDTKAYTLASCNLTFSLGPKVSRAASCTAGSQALSNYFYGYYYRSVYGSSRVATMTPVPL